MKIIFDLDGTLADCSHRQHFLDGADRNDEAAWDRFFAACIDDKPIKPIVELFRSLAFDDAKHNRIQIWTGRSEKFRSETEFWIRMELGLAAKRIERIRMRGIDDRRPDHELKMSWLMELQFCPDIVFEDRPGVVKAFRDRGIVCVQVSEGAY